MKESYKFEKFREQSFPVYSSVQQGSGTLVIPHFHEAAELMAVISGTVVCSIHTMRFVCNPGDTVFIPPYSVHSVICEDGQAQIRGMTFELSLIREAVFDIPVEKILNKSTVTEFRFPNGTAETLKDSFFHAVEVYTRNDATYKLEMLSCLYEITAQLIKTYFHTYAAYKKYDRIQPVIDYINENYRKDIPLTELSGLINVCDDHLIRLFRATTNKTPTAYIRDLRLQEALKLLLDSDRSVTDIAALVGFSSGNYMTRVFRTVLRVTPLQYRKNNKQAK